MNIIKKAANYIDLEQGLLKKGDFITSAKKLSALKGVFMDEKAFLELDPEQVIYTVQAAMSEEENTIGGLFWGTTKIEAGKVGSEYFMTRGHFHSKVQTAEYYWCISGSGVLIEMDLNRNSWGEEMSPGSLHYIPGGIAHRVANTGNTPLIFNACWPSDAGHNYEEIDNNGFSARLIEHKGLPTLLPE
jgi:glucose-6-phosphate isomerase, archaeal